MRPSHRHIRFTHHAIASAGLVAVFFTACESAPSLIAPPTMRPAFTHSTDATETGYFNGVVYSWQFPSQGSNDQNELIVECFHLGPDNNWPNGKVGTLYAVFLPGANQHSCPDGTVVHDHILSAVPGTSGYSTKWDLKEAWPGPNFNPSIMPITSEAALLSAAQLGQVIILDDELILEAVVTGPVH